MGADIVAYLYSAVIASGGIFAYFKVGSVPSLVAGVTFGSLAGFGAYHSSQNPNNPYILLTASSLLAGAMGLRAVSTGKFMPAGLIFAMSLGIVAKCCSKYALTAKNL